MMIDWGLYAMGVGPLWNWGGGDDVSVVLADSDGDPNVFYRQQDSETVYGRQGATDTTYSRSGGTDTNYTRV